jgi:hypothetical protein
MCVFPFVLIRLEKRLGTKIWVIKLTLAHKDFEGTVQLFGAALREQNSYLLIC